MKKATSETALTRAHLGRMKSDMLITQTRDGQYHLRSYGRAALVSLLKIAMDEAERMADAA